ncbi:cell division protein FtsL [Anianabacter salinae]|uniref:cell division protein FtsL n=1 Tax=Anianabacter salinae TaxID=2851023 RepID=UPI00225E26D0|nr:cell division protein FtsL [Anianabacter salinae]MBV0914071.1 cell division protein FtsL [Anianabacter salinae]
MRPILFLLTAFAVMGLAFWAYHQNYQTKAALDAVDTLNRDIARLRDERAALRAEWAYLNRPARLSELVELNYQRLDLSPFRPDQFGRVDEIPYPLPDAVQDLPLAITGAVDVSGTLPQPAEDEDSP